MSHAKALLQKAVDVAGSQSKLAEALGISQQGVSYYLNQAEQVSAELAIAIDKFTNGQIKRSELRPDLFGDAA